MARTAGAAGPRRITIGVRLSDTELAALDVLRGPLTRVEYLRSLLLRERKGMLTNGSTTPGDMLRRS